MSRLREYMAWFVIGGLVFGLIVYGSLVNSRQLVLKIALNKNDPVQMELVKTIKPLLIKQGGYHIALVSVENSQDAQLKLLQGKADLAVILPAALSQYDGLRKVSTLGGLESYLVSKQQKNIKKLEKLSPESVIIGAPNPDYRIIFSDVFEKMGESEWVSRTQDVYYGILPDSTEVNAALFFALQTDPLLLTASQDNRLKVIPWSSGDASLFNPFLGFNKKERKSDTSLSGKLLTPIVLSSGLHLPDNVAVKVNAVMSSAMAELLLNRFNYNDFDIASELAHLPFHPAILRYNNPTLFNQYIAKVVAFLNDYRWLILCSIVLIVIVSVQLKNIKQTRKSVVSQQMQDRLNALLEELFALEKKVQLENDMRVLKSVYLQVQSIKENGSKIMMLNSGFSQTQALVFIEQCRFLLIHLEARLGMIQQINIATRNVA